jgi:hypothetical protein
MWLQASLTVTKAETFVVRYRPGITLVPLHDPMQSGDASHRLRVIDARFANDTYTARVQGLQGRTYRLLLDTQMPVAAIDGAREVGRQDGKRVIEVTFPAPGTPGIEWIEREIAIRTRGR